MEELMTTNPFTVDGKWLFDRLGDPDLSIVDASWYLPTMMIDGQPRNPKLEYDARHIPGAVFYDIDAITDPQGTLPHTLASPEVFSEKVGALGIAESNTIVVYDGMGLFSAARAWWNFRIMGARNVFVLNGGLPKWVEGGFPVESDQPAITTKTFAADFNSGAVVNFAAMKAIVNSASQQIVDARPAMRFTGETPEPRSGIRSGHMPGACSVPVTDIAEGGQLLPAEALRAVFQKAGIDLNKPVATSCGSGVTAAALTLALATLGHSDNVLYDGSWTEWGGHQDTQIVTGPQGQ
jgi:thiosulfate/3-mercaptopyruvate sulfurtransferase